jgi:exonuclease SbcC
LIHNDLLTLTIENFQSHEKTVIKFAPGGQLTVITGQTDSGKTAIFRALRWLLYNQPQGTDFIRAGCTFTRVTGNYASGHIIIRERTASKNQYRIVTPGAVAPIVLEGFGNSVPVEVQEITGIRTVTIGDMDFNLNLAEQLDGPFLGNKSVSSGTRAKVMGKLAGTEVLDFAGKNVGTDLFRRNQDEKRLAGEVNGLQDAVAQYDYLPTLAMKIEAVDRLVEAIKVGALRRERLCLLKIGSENVTNLIAECDKVINRWQYVETAEQTVSNIDAEILRICKIRQVEGNLIEAINDISECENIIGKYKNIELAEEVVSKVTDNTVRVTGHRRNKLLLNGIVESIRAAESTIERFKNIESAEVIANQTDGDRKQLDQILELDQKIGTVELNIKRATDIKDRLKGVDEACAVVDRVAEKIDRAEKIMRLRSGNIACNIGIKQAEESVKQAEIAESAGTICSGLEAAINRRDTLCKTKVMSATVDRSIDDLKGSVIVYEQRVADLEGAYKDELTTLGVCPTCGAITNPLKKVS